MSTGLSYTVQFSTRSRRLSIKVDTQGQVIVSAPARFPRYRIAEFVEASRAWIDQQLAVQATKPILLSPTHVYYFGVDYPVRVSTRFDGTVKVGRDMLIVAPLVAGNVSDATIALLSTWLKSRAIEYVSGRVQDLALQMGVAFRGLAFKQQKTRWGSCSSQKNLNFNWKLIHAPKDVIDYVIIHELAHTVHMNHGNSFWDLVAVHDPDSALHRRWLQRFGSTED